jgi:intermediate cleaving peptidase 55
VWLEGCIGGSSFDLMCISRAKQAMKFTKPGITEGQLWAKLDFECRMRGSSMLAYVPVVAGGPNALSMHYVRNDMKLR